MSLGYGMVWKWPGLGENCWDGHGLYAIASNMSPSPSARSRSRSASRERPSKREKRHRSRTYSRSPSPTKSNRLHIANIDESIRKRDIEDAYGKFGKLADIWVASYPPFYAFVVYEHADDAAAALKEMKSGYVRDCHIRTSIALPRNSGRRGPPPRRFGGGGYGGGYGGGRRSPYSRRSRSPRHSRRRSPSPPRRSRSPRRRRRSSSGSR
ncbi:unnamed protein product [Bursaphelenchus xylophilus]|uniref:(pine wood nematode) hypothetical protein n=1 Tax=Bursaphelenchus xylophilus TaxID=6326 RepID=A0A1I7SA35_BURXY|nr:unnamed protein product [Bursaphelenchus xylophilus]CAG9131791.1 unnamed protein product [Bursaphelenchus xylophilus]